MNVIETLKWYEDNAAEYAEQSKDKSVIKVMDRVLDGRKSGKVLDFGCGAGRDTKEFLHRGFSVVSLDQSRNMINELYKNVGVHRNNTVVVANYVDYLMYNVNDVFDVIWCNASLVHLPFDALKEVVQKLYKDFLNRDGVLYMSFLQGMKEKTIDGRDFNAINLNKRKQLTKGFFVKDIEEWSTIDADGQRWYNVVLKK